ncbi:MAG: aminoacyl-tRNA deacylase [Deltaproteobacteria bacterium]|nr:aminoacyl-tRNA deacylase [Deltaproteobacteria bacterium]
MSAKQAAKTNAVRLLEGYGYPFELLEAEVDESDLSAERAAKDLGLSEELVYKTLVAKADRTGYVKAMLPAGRNMDMKALADVSGNRRASMIPVKDLLSVTGYIRGGCSPLGGKLRAGIFILDEALIQPFIVFNAGRRGLFVKMKPDDFILATGAEPCMIAHSADYKIS